MRGDRPSRPLLCTDDEGLASAGWNVLNDTPLTPRHPRAHTTRHAPAARPKPWLAVAFAVCVVGWGANQFAPMLLWYGSTLAVSTAVLQATFGMYAIGLIPGMLAGGPLSDRYGRKVTVAPALLVSLLATVVLMGGEHGVGWLLAGRLIAGAASGAAFSAGSAWIKELSGRPYDVAPDGAGARRATVAMSIGFGVGPLVAGGLGQWAPAAGVLAYAPHLALALAALPLVWRAPETRTDRTRTPALRPFPARSVRHPRFVRVVIPLAPWVFGAPTIAFAYLPGLVTTGLHGLAVAFSGLVTLLTAGAGVLVQAWARPLDRGGPARLLIAGLSAVIVGTLVGAVTAATAAPALVPVTAVLLGGGYGLCMVCGLLEVQRLARPDELASATAVYQACTYVGFAAPFLLAAAQRHVPPPALLLGTALLAALTLAWTAFAALRCPAPHPGRGVRPGGS
ncbi:MAG: MFS transporter [Carbonactinosporaceae bacterium]